MLPDGMTCIEIAEPGGPEVLKVTGRPAPRAGAGEVVIEVAAAGVNRPDLMQREGVYLPPPGASSLPGLEVAGTVVEAGEGVVWPRPGTPVCALVAGGGYAEYVAVNAGHCLPVPKGLTMAEAAALPETFFTVWHNVFERCQLKAGETFLVHGGAGGIGTTAIQLAKAFGAKVLATCRETKLAACSALGADRAIDYAQEDFVAVAMAATYGKGVDVILDMVGGDYIPRNIEVAAVEGRIASIAFARGSVAEVDFMPVMTKRLTLTGSTMRPQPDEVKSRIAAALTAQVWPLIEDGLIRPMLYATFPLAQAADAHRLMEHGTHIGKIILVVEDSHAVHRANRRETGQYLS